MILAIEVFHFGPRVLTQSLLIALLWPWSVRGQLRVFKYLLGRTLVLEGDLDRILKKILIWGLSVKVLRF